MDSIIKEFYKVADLMEIPSCEQTSLVDLAMDNVEDVCNILENMLGEKEREFLKHYTKAWKQAGDEIAISNFALGFKLGGRITADMLHGDL